MLDQLTGLSSGTLCAVNFFGGVGVGGSAFLPLSAGVLQGCILAPSPFSICKDTAQLLGEVV